MANRMRVCCEYSSSFNRVKIHFPIKTTMEMLSKWIISFFSFIEIIENNNCEILPSKMYRNYWYKYLSWSNRLEIVFNANLMWQRKKTLAILDHYFFWLILLIICAWECQVDAIILRVLLLRCKKTLDERNAALDKCCEEVGSIFTSCIPNNATGITKARRLLEYLSIIVARWCCCCGTNIPRKTPLFYLALWARGFYRRK